MQRLVQLVLDFCGGAQDFEPNRPQTTAHKARKAIEKIVNQAPAAPLGDLLSPAVFSHPEANRELLLEGARVAYHLARARRRSIGFTVGQDGLAVRAPAWVTLAAVDDALRAKAGWIVRKLAEQQARSQRQEDARIAWADGATLPYLGAPVTVVLDPARRHAVRAASLVHGADGARRLYVALPHGVGAQQLRDAVQAWLMQQARGHFAARLDHFAPQLGVRWARLALSGARTRWGSASADGSIRLNWRLMHYGPAVIDYVVVHELAHLRVMDHSPQFWSTVGSVLPDYEQRRGVLRDQPAPPW